jgi:hypothetical protein
MAATTRLGEVRSARERILQIAFRRFDAHDVHGAGIATVIAEPGGAKADVEPMVAPQAPATSLKRVPRS